MMEHETLGGPVQPEPLSGYRILVVDDDEDIRTFLLAVFADAGAQICEAADGDEALQMAVSERPDLITLDLSMPGRDGIEAFRDLRLRDQTAEIPIIIVTGHPEFRELIYTNSERAPEGFMNKPVDADELVKTVRRVLGLLQRRRERGSPD